MLAGACTAGHGDIFVGTGGSDSGTQSASGDTATATATGSGGMGSGPTSTAAQFMTGDASSGSGVMCAATPDEDLDQDGWTITQGDCNDCDKNVNPGALEVKITDPDPMTGVIPTPADEDCDGMVDNVVVQDCDAGIPLEAQPGLEGAHAIELCKASTGPKDWGLIEAAFVRANGAAAPPSPAYGILDSFGPNVTTRKGARMLGLSSGQARVPGQPDACGTQSCVGPAGTAPAGFPQNPPSCPVSSVINDDIGLQAELRAKSNANGFAFDFRFYSFEYPEYVCATFNDQFIALVSPAPPGSQNGNVSFDSLGNPVSVNFGLFPVCDNAPTCTAGASDMVGTGFNTLNRPGGTEWLQTTSPVKGLRRSPSASRSGTRVTTHTTPRRSSTTSAGSPTAGP